MASALMITTLCGAERDKPSHTKLNQVQCLLINLNVLDEMLDEMLDNMSKYSKRNVAGKLQFECVFCGHITKSDQGAEVHFNSTHTKIRYKYPENVHLFKQLSTARKIAMRMEADKYPPGFPKQNWRVFDHSFPLSELLT